MTPSGPAPMAKSEALAILAAQSLGPLGSEEVPLEEALGRILARDLQADVNAPPFNRSAMDGYALRSDDLKGESTTLRVIGEVQAGQVFPGEVGPGECTKIMTGAPLPAGADAVVMVELSETQTADEVLIRAQAQPQQNVAAMGQDLRVGQTVLQEGRPIRALEMAMLATIGCAQVPVYRVPKVTIVSTGDELIPVDAGQPGPGQIRESNGPMLLGLCLGMGLQAQYLGIAADTAESTREFITAGMDADVLILSGGVSMGDFDFVHRELKAHGLEVAIEKVAIKPGKPLLYGRIERLDQRPLEVFGLPGNPVSSYATFELFTRPFIAAMMGAGFSGPLEIEAELKRTQGTIKPIGRTQHLPARLWAELGRFVVEVIPWNGSGDLCGMSSADSFVIVELGESLPALGSRVKVLVSEPQFLSLSADQPPASPPRDSDPS